MTETTEPVAPTPKLCYAGIGSRETPGNILNAMAHTAAYLCSEGWTLRSGGAIGADTAFESGVDHYMASGNMKQGQGKNIYLPWANYNHNPSNLHPENIPFSDEEMQLASKFHPAWHRCSPSAKRMHARNGSIILGHQSVDGPIVNPVKFIVCWTKGGKIQGGTGQALRIAEAAEIPVINFGKATTPDEIEEQLLKLDELQKKFMEEANASVSDD